MSEKLPTLDAFIADYNPNWGERRYRMNSYVREPGFRHLYVRTTTRHILGEWREPVLDLANFEAVRPGSGTFTRLIKRLRHDYPKLTIYVESVLNVRFQAKLLSLGFLPGDAQPLNCFVLLA